MRFVNNHRTVKQVASKAEGVGTLLRKIKEKIGKGVLSGCLKNVNKWSNVSRTNLTGDCFKLTLVTGILEDNVVMRIQIAHASFLTGWK